jgi:AcrR family transcriptional regulator
MPANPKTSDAEIIAAALALIEEHGPEQLSMLAVAAAVGVRGPSLYKRFADRAALMNAVENYLFRELGAALTEAASGAEGDAGTRAMAFAYRGFAKRHGQAYPLLFSSAATGETATAIRLEAARPVLERLQRLTSDPAATLRAARALTAFCHGFVSMEIAAAFHLGGDIDEAFAEGVDLLLAGLNRRLDGKA